MANCTKYKVIRLYHSDFLGAQILEDWLNEQMEKGWEFVAVDGHNYIFKKNSYLISIKHVAGYIE